MGTIHWTDRLADTSEGLTFPQLHLRAVKMKKINFDALVVIRRVKQRQQQTLNQLENNNSLFDVADCLQENLA